MATKRKRKTASPGEPAMTKDEQQALDVEWDRIEELEDA